MHIYCDNTSTNLSKNPIQHSRIKHIDIGHHVLKDHVRKGDISLKVVSIGNRLADISTKPLPPRFAKLEENLALMTYPNNLLC